MQIKLDMPAFAIPALLKCRSVVDTLRPVVEEHPDIAAVCASLDLLHKLAVKELEKKKC
ncbi:MAG: hypothetical protein U1E51_21865 [Candidatus Binatia bacterium]|nr:hypothetical protein [Candidatus Binatia bacterium]